MGRSRLLAVVILGGLVFCRATALCAQNLVLPSPSPFATRSAPIINPAADRSLVRFLFEERGSEKLLDVLSRPTSIEVKDKPFPAVLQSLAKDVGINIVIDGPALAEESIATDTLVSLQLSKVPLRQVLAEMLHPLKLGFIYQGTVLKVTTSVNSRNLMTIRGYDVREITGPTETEVEELTDLIQEVISPETWAQNGGSGTIRYVNNFRMVLVRQVEAEHEEILNLLNELRKVRRTLSDGPPANLAIGEHAAERNLWKKVSVNWKQTPAREAFLNVAKQMGVTLQFDEVSLKQIGVALESPVTLSDEKISARQALDAIRRAVPRADFLFDRQILVITADEVTKSKRERRFYVVDDLAKSETAGKRDLSEVENLIKTRFGLSAWKEGAEHGIGQVNFDNRRLLVIVQIQRVHWEISAFLQELRDRFPAKLTVKTAAAEIASITPDPDPPTGRKANPNPDITPQVEAAIAGNNEFAFELYRKGVNADDNLVISPLSISAGFVLLQPSARGETAKELNKVLHFTLPTAELHPALAAILDRFNEPGKGKPAWGDAVVNNTLRFANQVWVDHHAKPFLPDYLKVIRDNYGIEPKRIDLQNLETARQTINQWVSNKTSQRIPELIKRGVLRNEQDPMVLATAVWLDARWDAPFSQVETHSGTFHAFGEDRRVKYMRGEQLLEYSEHDGLQMLQKNYLGDRLSMIVLLPKERGRKSMDQLEAMLTAQKLRDWRLGFKKQLVKVKLPKFQLRSQLDLKGTLQAMGLQEIWKLKPDVANLSGMNENTNRYLDFALHEAEITVDEDGTQASAATALGGYGGMGMQQPPEFSADRPFLFLIQDNRTGSILFLGRVMKP